MALAPLQSNAIKITDKRHNLKAIGSLPMPVKRLACQLGPECSKRSVMRGWRAHRDGLPFPQIAVSEQPFKKAGWCFGGHIASRVTRNLLAGFSCAAASRYSGANYS